MARCAGTTLKGEQCKREAREGSRYCSIHFEQPPDPQPDPATAPKSDTSWDDPDFVLKAALGLAALAAIVLFRIRR